MRILSFIFLFLALPLLATADYAQPLDRFTSCELYSLTGHHEDTCIFYVGTTSDDGAIACGKNSTDGILFNNVSYLFDLNENSVSGEFSFLKGYPHKVTFKIYGDAKFGTYSGKMTVYEYNYDQTEIREANLACEAF